MVCGRDSGSAPGPGEALGQSHPPANSDTKGSTLKEQHLTTIADILSVQRIHSYNYKDRLRKYWEHCVMVV